MEISSESAWYDAISEIDRDFYGKSMEFYLMWEIGISDSFGLSSTTSIHFAQTGW